MDVNSLDRRVIDLELTVLHLLRGLTAQRPADQQRTFADLAVPLALRERALVEAALDKRWDTPAS